jgi:phage terminase small subunit
MAKQERQQKSTLKNMVETFQTVNNLPMPPIKLDPEEMIVFERVIRSREVSTWSDHDIQIAANLAQMQVQLQATIQSVKLHGRVVVGPDGSMRINPECALMTQFSTSVKSMTAMLGLTAGARGVAGIKQRVRDKHERDVRKIVESTAEEDLLA